MMPSALLAASAAWGQAAAPDSTNTWPRGVLETPPPENLNKVGLSYRMGMNITVDFKKLGGFPPVSDPGPATGSAVNRGYDNGSYIRVDSSGNAGDATWYWGYETPSQLQGGGLVMQSSTSQANAVSNNQENNPQHGFEASYSRQLYRHDKLRFGLEAAFGMTLVDASDSHTLYNTVNRITDTYTIPGGVSVVPAAPYHGTFEGPGPLMSSAPDRVTTVLSSTAIITGDRKINSDVYTLRLGPYFEFPIYKQLSFILSGGLTLAVAATEFSYNETVTISDTGQVSGPRSSSGSQTDFLVGGYVAGNLSLAVTKEVSLFVGAQFQSAGTAVTDSATVNNQPVTKKESVLDLGQSIMLVFGVSYSF